ncbi:DUF6746 family protein [Paraglaciecola sp.]|uniref:DUF6746 family protein n=1 Tax=Paraglaciecola sp. TaxID=1920173 RepID=UPI003EF26082
MKSIKILISVALLISLTSLNSEASDVSHFKGQPSPDLHSALCNLQKFDAQLKTITSKPLSPNAMAKIHQLTYTLEVAVQRVQTELATAAVELEKVHKGSETMSEEKVKNSAQKYLAVTQALTANLTCR